jgi:hypothetical protein
MQGDAYSVGIRRNSLRPPFRPGLPTCNWTGTPSPVPGFSLSIPPGLIFLWLFPNTFGCNCFVPTYYLLARHVCYPLCQELDLDEPPVFLGGLLFLGRGCLMAQKEYQTKGYQTMMSTTVWLPLILCFAARYASTGERREPVFAGLAVAASLLGGFPQVTVYGPLLAAAFRF